MRSILVLIFLKFLLFMRISRHFADSVCSILSSKSTCFRRRSDSHWTILSEKLFLCNQIYRLFHAFSFLIIPLSRQIIYYVIWNILQCHSLTQEKSCKQDSPSATRSFSDIIPLHRSTLLPGRLYFFCIFMYVIGTLQSNLL